MLYPARNHANVQRVRAVPCDSTVDIRVTAVFAPSTIIYLSLARSRAHAARATNANIWLSRNGVPVCSDCVCHQRTFGEDHTMNTLTST